jgi:hypothetical protein
LAYADDNLILPFYVQAPGGAVLMRNRVKHLLLPLFLVTNLCDYSLLFGQSHPSASEESSNASCHSTVSEVRLVLFATDEHRHAVQDLQKTDFAVIDDERVIRDFRSFTRPAAIKLDVIVLFDSSESVLPHFKQEITEVLRLVSQCRGVRRTMYRFCHSAGGKRTLSATEIAAVHLLPIGLLPCPVGDPRRYSMLLTLPRASSASAGSLTFGL